MAGDLTEARRARVRSLWIKTDREIAETLIEEGYGGATPRTADGKRKQIASMQRNVWNDRAALKKRWREMERATHQDANETLGEHLAVLDSYRDLGIEKLTDKAMKGTPFAQTLMALTRIQESRAKATGVAESAPTDPDAGKERIPVLGLILGTKNVTPEMRARLREQGVKIDDDEGDE